MNNNEEKPSSENEGADANVEFDATSETIREMEAPSQNGAAASEHLIDPTEEVSVPAATAAAATEAPGLKEELDKYKDRLLRTAAEFENFKKRSKKQSDDASRKAEENVVNDFLPISDNLERALEHAQKGELSAETQALIDGIRMVQKQFAMVLDRYGISAFNSTGETFDPELHEALQQANSSQPRNTIINEVQKGYRRNGKLLRPALVIVSQGPADEADIVTDTTPPPTNEEGKVEAS